MFPFCAGFARAEQVSVVNSLGAVFFQQTKPFKRLNNYASGYGCLPQNFMHLLLERLLSLLKKLLPTCALPLRSSRYKPEESTLLLA